LKKKFKDLVRDLEMLGYMTEGKVYEKPYGPTGFESLKKLLDKAVFM